MQELKWERLRQTPTNDDDEEEWREGWVQKTDFPVTVEDMLNGAFDLWVCHCFEPITQGMAEELVDVPGLEGLHIFSNYQIWVGIAKLHDEEKVKNDIARILRG